MRYTIKRVSLGSALKIGLLLGWIVALLPALVLAALVMTGVQRVAAATEQVQTYEIELLGQPIASIDLLALLGLDDESSRLQELAAQGWGLFSSLALLFVLVGGAMAAATALLVCLCYNLLAALAGGLIVELREVA
jgi:hypothetical protein